MTTASPVYRIVVSGLLVGGLVSMYLARPSEWVVSPWERPTVTILWTVMLMVASLSQVPLPRRRYGLSLVTAWDMGAFLVFGPAVAAWCAIISRLIAISADRWNPFSWSLARVGSVALAFGISGWLYQVLGGNAGVPALGTAKDYLAAFGAASAYLAVRISTESFFLAVRWGVTGKELWKRELNLQVLFDLALLPFAVLLALTQLHLGVVGVALFLVPLLLVRYSIKLWMDTRNAHLVTVRVLMDALDASGPFTRGVSKRVSGMALKIGAQLNLPEKELEELEYASLLHDIGRFAIHGDILGKPARLNEEEADTLALGPRYAYDMIQNIGLFQGAAEIVLNHHERPDGKGYPRGISGNAIPVGSRIIMVASAFNAMTSDRPYRKGLGPREAIEELLVHTGTQFSPEVVEALIALYSNRSLIESEDTEPQAFRHSGPGTYSLIPKKKVPTQGPRILELPFGGSKVSFKKKDRNGLEVKASAKSDIGCVRAQNEDAIILRTLEDKSLLMGVADGMGGANGGAVASSLAAEHFKSITRGDSQSLKQALDQANCIIHERGSQDEDLKGMGTTATVVSIKGRTLSLAHVGDSRAYLINAAGLNQLTRDHTLGMELKRSVNDVAGIHGVDHVLTRCLGVKASVAVDSLHEPIRLESGDCILLCSDGLTGVVEDNEISTLALTEDPATACRDLVELAIERGGPDNISVVIGRVS